MIADRGVALAAEDVQAWLAAIVDSSFDAIIAKSLDGTIISWNAAAERIYGYRAQEVIGRSIQIIVPPDRVSELFTIYERLKLGERVAPFETERVTKDGRRLDVSLTVSPIRDRTGQVAGASAIARDITAQRRAQEHRELLVRELDHRVRNVLASIRSIAACTLRTTPEPDRFVEAFETRLDALARTHALLTGGNWEAVSLRELVELELAPYRSEGEDQLTITGPPCTLTPEAASALGMVLHELATNAMKYGALSRPGGRVEITWAVEGGTGAPRLRLTWRERDGPPVVRPTRRGFGWTVITRSLAYQLDGTVRLAFRRPGVRCVIELPLGAQAAPPQAIGATHSIGALMAS